MTLLGIDVGSSSVKAAVLRGGKVVGGLARVPYNTDFRGPVVEVPASRMLKAVANAIENVGRGARSVDHVALSVMAPAWVAMDWRGQALTPLITHQDRRAVDEAVEIERRVGKARHLRLAGNRPFPGGISSTTWLWHARHQKQVIRHTALVGHLNTFLVRQLTGARVIDPSNASFTGLYRTIDQGGWSDELCSAIGVPKSVLPEILQANEPAGKVTRQAARRYGLTDGTPVLTGIVDTSSAMLLAGAAPGQLINIVGSTDVLAVCTDRPTPTEKLLTRALGVGKLWMSVSTLAAAGSTIVWAKEQLFPDLSWPQFKTLIKRLATPRRLRAKPRQENPTVSFEPYLAGDRASIEQRRAAFNGLTLSTTREEMLAAVVESLSAASAARFTLLRAAGTRLLPQVLVSGGAGPEIDKVLHRHWDSAWRLKLEMEATLRGLAKLEPRA